MTIYQHILITLENFEIVTIWALFCPVTAVGCGDKRPRKIFLSLRKILLIEGNTAQIYTF